MSFIKKTEDQHVHKFTEQVEKKVLSHKKSLKTFIDVLKQRKCECGAVETYDLERIYT